MNISRNEPWVYKLDLVQISIPIEPARPLVWTRVHGPIVEEVKKLFQNPKVFEGASRWDIFNRYTRIRDKTTRIDIFWQRNAHEPHKRIAACLKFSVVDKQCGYGTHVERIKAVTEILWEHDIPNNLSYCEPAMDAPTHHDLEMFAKCLHLKHSREAPHYYKTTQYTNKRNSARQLAVYTKAAEQPDGESKPTLRIDETRKRVELRLDRDFLRRKRINTIYDALQPGPDLLLSQIALYRLKTDKVVRAFKKNGVGVTPNYVQTTLAAQPTTDALAFVASRLKISTADARRRFCDRLSLPPIVVSWNDGAVGNAVIVQTEPRQFSVVAEMRFSLVRRTVCIAAVGETSTAPLTAVSTPKRNLRLPDDPNHRPLTRRLTLTALKCLFWLLDWYCTAYRRVWGKPLSDRWQPMAKTEPMPKTRMATVVLVVKVVCGYIDRCQTAATDDG